MCISAFLSTCALSLSFLTVDAFTDSAISAKVNGEHKEKDLEPWDGGEGTTADELEALETDVVSISCMMFKLRGGGKGGITRKNIYAMWYLFLVGYLPCLSTLYAQDGSYP